MLLAIYAQFYHYILFIWAVFKLRCTYYVTGYLCSILSLHIIHLGRFQSFLALFRSFWGILGDWGLVDSIPSSKYLCRLSKSYHLGKSFQHQNMRFPGNQKLSCYKVDKWLWSSLSLVLPLSCNNGAAVRSVWRHNDEDDMQIAIGAVTCSRLNSKCGVPSWLSGFFWACHPATQGLRPKHTVNVLNIYIVKLVLYLWKERK